VGSTPTGGTKLSEVPARHSAVYDESMRAAALVLHADGHSVATIHKRLGPSRHAIASWLADPDYLPRIDSRCFVCARTRCPTPEPYLYLLGQYLGDGYLATSMRVPRLRIACADSYPNIAAEVDAALRAVSGNRPGFVQNIGCSDRGAYWKHWTCLLPQHGPGRKHERAIVLRPWQQDLADVHPWALIRGLIHSDGCRSVNTVTTKGKRYSYPRYFFANESRDILAIMGSCLDAVGVPWRFNRPNSISVARATALR
jgi:hypothetical protein